MLALTYGEFLDSSPENSKRALQDIFKIQGRIQDFWKGIHMSKGLGVRFTDFISFFLNIS